MNISNIEKQRKPYKKPMLEKIQLRLEEAVLGQGCKTTNLGGGLGMSTSQNCVLDGNCLAQTGS